MATEVAQRDPETTGEPKPLPPHVREHYEAIRQKEQSVRELEKLFLDAKRQAKGAKEDFEAADLELRNLIADGLDPQTKLPFPAEQSVEEDPDAWRSAPIEELVLPPKLKEKLFSAGIETIGQLEDFRAEVADAKAVWPKGVNTAKVTAIENAVLAWLSDHRDHWGQPVAGSEAAIAT